MSIRREAVLRPAGFWLRFWAWLFDFTVLVILVGIVDTLVRLGFGVSLASFITGLMERGMTGSGGAIIAVGAILLTWIGVVTVSWLLSQILGWIYYAFCETRPARGTPGKQILSLQVTDLRGGTVSWGRATLRHLFKFAAYFPFLIVLAILIIRFLAGGLEGAGKSLAIALVVALVVSPLLLFAFYALAGWTRDKRALHDLLSGCRVVRTTELSGGRMLATVAGIVFFFFVVEILLPAALKISKVVLTQWKAS